jgi:hypothetical protein
MIDTIQRDASHHYSLALGLLDRLTKRKDEMLTDAGIRAARARVWHMAVALSDAPDQNARSTLLVQLDQMATATARLVAPKVPAALATFVSSFRRWDRALARLFIA